MKTDRICASWFTGTGTTKKIVTAVAGKIAEVLGAEYKEVDFTLPKARKKPLEFEAGEVVVLGVPVIAGRVPNVLLKYLALMKGEGAIGIPVVLFGNRNYDDALIELRDIMEDSGIRTIAAGAFVGEHSFSDILAAGRPDSADIEKAIGLAKDAAEKIAGMQELPKEPVKVEGTPKPYRGYYMPRDRHGVHIDIRKVLPKTGEDCDDCGICADVCPMGSISHENVRELTGICIKCCACIKKCPRHAKYFDDKGYLYHQHELEDMYGGRRAEPDIFV